MAPTKKTTSVPSGSLKGDEKAAANVKDALDKNNETSELVIAAPGARASTNAAAARVADDAAAVSDEKTDTGSKLAGTYTAIHPIIRDGKLVPIGGKIALGHGEDDHIQDLLDTGVIAKGEDAKAKMEQADLSRAQTALKGGA